MSIILGIFLIIVNALFNGFILMEVYELAFMPFLQIIYNPPTIQYTVFILVGMGINICRKQSSTEYKEYKITDINFWYKWISIVFTKLLTISILWLFNLVLL